MALAVKNIPANAGDMRCGFNPCVRKLPLEEGMAIHSSILAWESPWTKEHGRLNCTESDMTEAT